MRVENHTHCFFYAYDSQSYISGYFRPHLHCPIQKQNCDGTKLVRFCSRVKNFLAFVAGDVVLGGLMGAMGAQEG